MVTVASVCCCREWFLFVNIAKPLQTLSLFVVALRFENGSVTAKFPYAWKVVAYICFRNRHESNLVRLLVFE